MKDEGRETKDETIVHRHSHEAAVIPPPSFIKREARNTNTKPVFICVQN